MKFFTLLLALFFPLILPGQSDFIEIKFEQGEKLRNSARRSLPEIIGYDAGGGMYALQTRFKRSLGYQRKESVVYYLQYFNQDLRLMETERLDLKHKGQELSYQFMTLLDGTLYLFTSYFDENAKTESLLAQQVNPVSLIPGEPLKIAEIQNPGKNGFFRFRLSAGKKRMLIAYARYQKGDNEQNVDLFVLDENLHKVWEKANCLHKTGTSFIVEQYRIDDEGNAFLLSTFFPDKRIEKRQGAPSYQYYLTSFRKNGQEQEDFGINLKDKFITDLQIRLTADNRLIGGGFYADKGSYAIKGSYAFTIDIPSSKVISRSVKEFETGFLPQQSGLEVQKRGALDSKLRQYGFLLHDILLREDGSAVLLGEQYFVSSASSFGKRSKEIKSNFYYDFYDIVAVNISPEGAIEWVEKIEKEQKTCNDAGLYSSFSSLLLNGNLYCFFNTFPFNYGNFPGKKGGLSHMQAVMLDSYGRTSHPNLPPMPDQSLTLIPKSGDSLGKHGLTMLAVGRKKNCFLKVSIKSPGILSRR